jgi:YihY family inner membrane protein
VALTDLPEQAVRRLDDFQQDRTWLAHPIGAVRKYADDRGSALAGLVTLQVFLGMLPLLVVALTVLGEMLARDDDFAEAVLESTAAQFPVLGQRLQEDIGAIGVSGPWIAVSILGLLWTAAGIYHSMQLAMNQVWNVEGIHRQGFAARHLRAMLLFVLVVSAAIGSAFVRDERLGIQPTLLADVLSTLAAVLFSAVLLLAVLRIVVAPVVPWVLLVPAALLSGLFWQFLQGVGTWIVVDQLAEAEDLYGGIGFVVVVLLWINLLARSIVFANEWAVVSWRGLWPRRIAQPPLTEADRRVLAALARNERRRPEEHVRVEFDERADHASSDAST